ncbi:hypothetical protein CAP36_15950 [Chitinophagaceae bacterium IBVUCB2]|nr:hypothetical protein CAP36_15950 [Chitinophagaceae bacterium IBVUCB2]
MKLIQQQIILLAFVVATSTTSCNNSSESKTEPDIKKTETSPTVTDLVFDKMLGTWQSEDGKSFERWARNDKGGYNSAAYTLKGTDTSWNEQATIYLENNNWIFENTVKGQNDGKAVRFVSSILQSNTVQFSNPAHDFPTDINYTIADANTLNAFIVGPNKNGGKDTIPFNYKRVIQ